MTSSSDNNKVLKKLKKFINKDFDKGLVKGLENISTQIVNTSITNIMSKSKGSMDGQLASSMGFTINEKTLESTIGTNLKYAIYYHQGTGLYAMNGDGRKEVPWHFIGADGQWWHTKGQKPNPFLQDAIDSDIPKYWEKAFGEGVKGEWKSSYKS